ncbi:MAG: hypothetical protein WDO74_26010 [Pseudomonadota bacterium]
MDERQPISKPFETDTQVIEQSPIGEIDLPGRRHGFHQGRDVVQDQAQVALGRAGGLDRALSIVDIDVSRAIAAEGARGVTEWFDAELEPSMLAVEASQTRFDLARHIRGENRVPTLGQAVDVVAMNSAHPARADRLLCRKTGVTQPALTEVHRLAIGSGEPHEHRIASMTACS